MGEREGVTIERGGNQEVREGWRGGIEEEKKEENRGEIMMLL